MASAVEAATSAISDSRNQNKGLEEKNAQLSGQLNELASQNSALTEKLGAEQKSAEEKTVLLADTRAALNESKKKELELTARGERITAEQESDRASLAELRSELQEAKVKNATLNEQSADLASQVSVLTEKLSAEQKSAEEKLKMLTEARSSLSDQFKSLANDILEEKSKKFTEQNQSNIGQLLDPLKEKIIAFQAKVEEVYVKEGTDRATLAGQVQELAKLNKTLSEDAQKLSSALKGSGKAQGNWGELMLERVLEASGLRKGHEYDVQESHLRENGTRAQPDVVIHLPNDRHLVVDSKVSLTAYETYYSSDDEGERQSALKNHMLSIRNHIKGLSLKKYEDLHGERSLDCVLMFVPIEPAFMAAITNDDSLFMEAWDKNVLLVSPSTLLFVVRTVAHLWRTEAQNRNAQDIARRGAALYEKFVGFVNDLEKVGASLKQAQGYYDESHKKLASGSGNLARQAQLLLELGIKSSKSLPSKILDMAMLEET